MQPIFRDSHERPQQAAWLFKQFVLEFKLEGFLRQRLAEDSGFIDGCTMQIRYFWKSCIKRSSQCPSRLHQLTLRAARPLARRGPEADAADSAQLPRHQRQ